MKKFLLALFALIALTTKAQEISNIVVSRIDDTHLNVKLHVHAGNVVYFIDHKYEVVDELIDLKLCFQQTVASAITDMDKEFVIELKSSQPQSYNLIVGVYDNHYQNGCIYQKKFDEKEMEFETPLTNPAYLSIEERSTNETVLFPNPSNGYLKLDQLKDLIQITISDLNGKLVYTSKNNQFADLSRLNDGIYFIQVETSSGKFIQRLVLNK